MNPTGRTAARPAPVATALHGTAASTTGSGLARPRGLARRILDGLVVAALGGLGALGTLIGTGLSLIGSCCAGPALAAGGATLGAATACGAAAMAWPFLSAGLGLLTAAALLARRRHRPTTAGRTHRLTA
ncbi:hypothetical protein [Pseudonocardia nigra]|uniref:hypothetical protein n=1 Tax=Pseudonocardia nigra TaxID=1921578 RepID=UPI001C5FEB7B|nr:hypothetical protein [Pseudonocardia nigra]